MATITGINSKKDKKTSNRFVLIDDKELLSTVNNKIIISDENRFQLFVTSDNERASSLLPVYDMEGEQEYRLLYLCKEIASEYGNLDGLFVDKYGILTLLELKRAKDARARREVMMQILDYGNGITRMDFEEICNKIYQNRPDLYTEPDAKSKSEVIVRRAVKYFYDDDSHKNCKAFAEAMRENLKKGYVRLCIAAEEISQSLVDLAAYVTSGSPNFAIGIFELSINLLEEQTYFVPHLKFATRRFPHDAYIVASIIKPPRTPLTVREFYNLLANNVDNNKIESVKEFFSTIKAKSNNFYFPEILESSIAIKFKYKGKRYSLLIILTNGKVNAGWTNLREQSQQFKDAYIHFIRDSAKLFGVEVDPNTNYWQGGTIDKMLGNIDDLLSLLAKFRKILGK